MSNREITVLYFAAASTAAGTSAERILLPQPGQFRLSSLGALLILRHPKLAEVLPGSRWSVDVEMIDDPEEVILQGGEEVAVICPVSGG
jgi:molybdopterin converting factor small subunit